MTFDTLPPTYWESLAIVAAMVLILVVGGSLVIRLIARGAEKRLERERFTTLAMRHADESYRRKVVEHVPTYPTVPVTVWDLPAFARRRRSGESFTEFAERVGLE
jgi:hypothetical protein